MVRERRRGRGRGIERKTEKRMRVRRECQTGDPVELPGPELPDGDLKFLCMEGLVGVYTTKFIEYQLRFQILC